MDTALIVAFVAAGASVVAAFFSWSQALRVAKTQGDADFRIAEFTGNLDRRKRALEAAMEEVRPDQEALDAAWADLQAIKEVIARVLGAHQFDRATATGELTNAVDRLTKGYGAHGMHLADDPKRAWHEAKSTASAASMLLLRGGKLIADPPAPVAEQLRVIRETLTERQSDIAKERESIRDRMSRRVLALL